MRALVSSAWSTAPEFSRFGISLSLKQWLSHKAVLDSDITAASDSTDSSAWVIGVEQCLTVLKHCMPVLVTAKHYSGPMAAVVRSYAGSARALLRHRNQVYKCPQNSVETCPVYLREFTFDIKIQNKAESQYSIVLSWIILLVLRKYAGSESSLELR